MKRLALTCVATLFWAGCATISDPSTSSKSMGASSDSQKNATTKKSAGDSARDAHAAEHQVAATLRSIEARVRKGESAQMRQEFMERLSRHPDDVFARLFLAWIDAPLESAGTQLNALSKMNPEEPWLRTALARIYLRWKGFTPQARAELDQVFARQPDFIPAMAVRAELEYVEGKIDEAVLQYRAILARDPLCFEAQSGLAAILEELGDLESACTALEAALAIDEDDPVLLRKLAGILSKRGEEAEVLSIYEKLLTLQPGDLELRHRLSALRRSLGDLDGAVQELELLRQAEPTFELTRQLVELYGLLARPQEEQRALEALIHFDEGASVENYRRLFQLRRQEGDLEGAETALRQAIDRDPGDLSLRILLAENLRERDVLILAILAHREGIALGLDELRQDLKALEARVDIPLEPMRGNVTRLYNLVHLRLKKSLSLRHRTQPWLGGSLGIRATITANGKISEVQITKNTLQDPELTALVYFSILDAELPGERPRNVSFEFVLSPIKSRE